MQRYAFRFRLAIPINRQFTAALHTLFHYSVFGISAGHLFETMLFFQPKDPIFLVE